MHFGSGCSECHEPVGFLHTGYCSRKGVVSTGVPASTLTQKELEISQDNDQRFKADGGKLRPALLFRGMPRAIKLVVAVLSYGAQKYEDHSWKNVNPMSRYDDARFRHMLDDCDEPNSKDDESGLLHTAHEITNLLFLLQDKCSKLTKHQFASLLRFKAPPQDHKL